MSVELRGTVIYPMFPTNAAMTSIRALERTNISSYRGPTTTGRPGVRAAAPLGVNSSTEVIDVNRLSQRSTSVTRYVRVADSKGRLYCVDGLANASCWLKIVTLARDCQSSNVELISTEKGVALKTIKCVSPGEPLLMWFNQNLLATMNMPFLTPSNIQGQNRYICHICNNHFEYPNPLKIHLVLKCNRLDSDHLWNILAKEFNSATPRPSLPLNFFTPSIEPFGFELSGSPRTSPTRISPIIADTPDSSASLANDSPTSSNRASPTSSNGPSPNSSKRPSPESSLRISPSSSSRASPVRKTLAHRGTSAFKPYANKPNVLGASHGAVLGASRCNETTMHSHGGYRRVAPPAPLRTDDRAARMETIVSNLGKSKQGHLCIYCGKVYSRKYGLKIHIRTHTGYKPLKCKFCLRPFGDPSNLNKHVRLHADGETPYRCELCGKILVRRRDLERHVRSRHHRENAGHVSDASSDGTNA